MLVVVVVVVRVTSLKTSFLEDVIREELDRVCEETLVK
jgi:hypothetical protein